MTISYNWLHEYLPVTIEPERLSKILTAVGLEVESLEKYESLKGGLQGLVIGEVLTREKHRRTIADRVRRSQRGSRTKSDRSHSRYYHLPQER
jgi:ribosomal protein L12E/L44/L45/RPP1/RPP2